MRSLGTRAAQRAAALPEASGGWLLDGDLRRRLLLLGGAAGMALATLYFLTFDQGLRFLQKAPPDWTATGWLRAAGCIAAALLLVLALRPGSDDKRDEFWLPAPADARIACATTMAMLFVVYLIGTFLIMHPAMLYSLVNEYAPAEMISESLLLASALCCFATAFILLRSGAGVRDEGAIWLLKRPLILTAMGLVLFLITMEEISWGQKFLRWSTPGLFAANLQNETNLHNFYTHRFEFFYYSAAVFLFTALPFLWARTPRHPAIEALGYYVPARFFVLPGLLLTPFLYETWNIVPFQICFFMGLAMLGVLLSDVSDRGERVLILIVLVGMSVGQVASLVHGPLMTRAHDLTEVRELLISIMIFFYAVWLARKCLTARAGTA